MLVPGSVNPLLLTSAAGAAAGGISRSIRLNAPDSAYLSRTPGSAGNRRTWTWAGWVKRSALDSQASGQTLFNTQGGDANTNFIFQFDDGGGTGGADTCLGLHTFGGDVFTTSALFRDVSAWCHIILAIDTTQATSADRVKLYVNGSQIALNQGGNWPTLNFEFGINTTQNHAIGRHLNFSGYFFDGYLADIHFIDGQALTPSSFTEVSATTGQLIPKAYAGTYTGNSFWLKFNDNSAATATTLGKDSFLLGNNWTPNNLSVTAGAGNDSLVDTPTSYGTDTGAGGEVRGNYCTLNPLAPSGGTFSNGNLDWASPTTDQRIALSTISISAAGKWYCEYTMGSKTGSYWSVGIFGNPTVWSPRRQYRSDGSVFDDSSPIATYASFTQGDIIGLAFDSSTSVISFYKNGTLQGSLTASPSASSTNYYFGCTSDGSGGSMNYSANFGQRAFAYTAPSGFKALCDTNLPAPVVAKPNTVMDVKLWTANGSSQSITGLGFQPDLVWAKSRNTGATPHLLVDSVRGVNQVLYSHSTGSEENYSTIGGCISAFNSDGFATGGNSDIATNNRTFVAWTWDAGTSTVSNTQGSITSSVRANASAGFSIVSFNSGSSGAKTIGHGLGVAPQLLLSKGRDNNSNWVVYHSSATNVSQFLMLNSTNAVGSSSNIWGSAAPTSTVFGFDSGTNQAANANIICYAFAPVTGYSSFGSYTGNGSADGPFVFCGFRPRWVLIKNTTGSNNWELYDAARDPNNVVGKVLLPNTSDAEITNAGATPGVRYDFLSNGFKLRDSQGSVNGSGNTIIFAAFAESPFQYARAR